MRFANITFNNSYSTYSNIGENIQIMAIDYLYEFMGIPREEIVRINFMKMSEYRGEYVVLPINWYFHKFFKYGVQNIFSDRILPVFLGASFMSSVFSEEEAAFLKMHEPIGCRDEWTFSNLRNLGIDAYLNGCMTCCFPRRESSPEQKKIFCVDIPKKLIKYMPEDIKKNAEFVTQVFDGPIDDIDGFARNIYEKYKAEAKLIITSRMHCASPCVAAGIPAILAIPQCIYTLGWIERYIPIYTEGEFADINWNAEAVDYEDMKIQILENAKEKVLQAYHKYCGVKDISYFYETRKKTGKYIIPNVTPVLEFLNETWKQEDEFTYGFWGITGVSDMIYEHIRKNFPRAKLEKIFDKGYAEKGMAYRGINAETPMNINNDNLFIFVTAYSATDEAKEYFRDIGKKDDEYYLCCDMKKSF